MTHIGDKNPQLIIDPGHGGNDPGGGSNKLWKEKDKVLDISIYQYNRFKELGVKVALTRNSDKTLSSTTRTNIVKSSGARYCISNHINAGGGEGAEVIYSIYATDELAKRVLNALVNEGAKYRRIFTRTLPNNSKADYYFMHRETGTVETIIVEYGFADNTTDANKIDKNWKAYAEAVVEAFCNHIGHKYTAPNGTKNETKKETVVKDTPKQEQKTYKVVKDIKGYFTSSDAKRKVNSKTTVKTGTYYIFNESSGMINVSSKKNTPGSWINPADNKKTTTNTGNKYTVKDKVVVKSSAKNYATGPVIPSWVKGKVYTVEQVKTDRILLKEIKSWVFIKDIEMHNKYKAPTGIKAVGKIKMTGVRNFTYIYESISDKSKRLGQAKKNQVFDIAGSVPGWWEIIYNGRRAYIKSQYASRI